MLDSPIIDIIIEILYRGKSDCPLQAFSDESRFEDQPVR
jgi:hypothetical protein